MRRRQADDQIPPWRRHVRRHHKTIIARSAGGNASPTRINFLRGARFRRDRPGRWKGFGPPSFWAATLPSGHRNRPRSGLGPGEPSWIDDHRQGCLSATAIWRVLKRESRFWNHPPLHGRARAQSYQSTTDGEILRQLFPRLSADLCHVALDRSKVGASLPRPWYPVRSKGQHAHRRRAASGNNATLSPLPLDFG